MSKPVILTGIRSNEAPTIANYLGAFLPIVAMQKQHSGAYQINMFVPDLHSFTTPVDHSVLYRNTLDNIKYFIAAGLDITDPDTYIYRQSYIPAHSELTWILDCFTYVGEMSRMTQFKDKSGDHGESVSMGLFNYPVLMATDILLYNAAYIPVGKISSSISKSPVTLPLASTTSLVKSSRSLYRQKSRQPLSNATTVSVSAASPTQPKDE